LPAELQPQDRLGQLPPVFWAAKVVAGIMTL
jgi:hypothetical protein